MYRDRKATQAEYGSEPPIIDYDKSPFMPHNLNLNSSIPLENEVSYIVLCCVVSSIDDLYQFEST